jgi:hypothetical protein
MSLDNGTPEAGPGLHNNSGTNAENKNSTVQRQSLTPSIVFDKALDFMSARWLCIGSPQRDLLARQYCESTPAEQTKGITLRRVDQERLEEYLRSLAKEDRDKEQGLRGQIEKGDVPREFLLPEETISHDALMVMRSWSEESFFQPDYMRTASFPGESYRGSRKLGSVSYCSIEDNNFQAFGLPHHIREAVEDSSLKHFFDRLEKYAGHPWTAKTYFFDSPSFGSGMGDAEARQKLHVFSNGSFLHTTYNGKSSELPGIYNSPESDIEIRTEQISIDSPVGICRFRQRVVIPINPDEAYVNAEGETVVYQGLAATLLVSSCNEIPEDVVQGRKAQRTDERLKLIQATSWQLRGVSFLRLGNSIQQLDRDWIYRKDAYHKTLADSHILLCGDYADPVEILDKDTVFFGRSYVSTQFFSKGSVVSQTGHLLSDPEKAEEYLILVQDGQPPKLSTHSEVVQLLHVISK